MIYNNFDQLIANVKGLRNVSRVALAGAHDAHSVEAVLNAQKENIVVPVLVGNREKVKETLRALGADPGNYEIVDSFEENPGKVAVELVRDGGADFLMKGGIDTKSLLKPLVDKTNRMHTGRVMTSIALAQIPSYHKLMLLVDGGMVVYPDLQQKKEIIQNSVEMLSRLGYERPNVAALCGVEVVNEKMIETVDAAALVKMNQIGELAGCNVVGPISYDLIFSKESAVIKGYDCTYCDDFDVILVPTLVTGNALTKSWVYTAGAKWAGVVWGAKVPVVLTSRGSSAEEKFLSLALAALTSKEA